MWELCTAPSPSYISAKVVSIISAVRDTWNLLQLTHQSDLFIPLSARVAFGLLYSTIDTPRHSYVEILGPSKFETQ